MHDEVWTKISIPQGEWLRWVSPEFILYIKKEEDELLVGKYTFPHVQNQQSTQNTCNYGLQTYLPCKNDITLKEECNSEVKWNRYAIGKEDRLEFSPLLPDRPVVVIPFVGRKLPPGRKGDFFFKIPLWAGVYNGEGEKRVLLMEEPVYQLSLTWFGDMQSGELCYGFRTILNTVHPSEETSISSPFEAEVRLHLDNTGSTMLDFSKISIHAENLTLYRVGNGLRTNDVFVEFFGMDQVSQVRFGRRAPKGDTSMDKVAPPRIKPDNNFFKRSFSFLKSLAEK